MTTAIDTNVLADIQIRDPRFFEASVEAIGQAAGEGVLIVSDVVYAELSAKFSMDELDNFLADLRVQLIPSSCQALHRAGQAFEIWARSRGAEVQCSSCGHRFTAKCPACGGTVVWRQHLIADFMVGAHAEVHAGTLLTRDRGIYARFFPDLVLKG